MTSKHALTAAAIAAAAAESKAKPEVVELANKYRAAMTTEGKTGDYKVADGTFEANLPEGTSKASFQQHLGFLSTSMAALQLALGEESIPGMVKHKDLDTTTVTLPMFGKDHISAAFNRSAQVRAPGSDSTRTSYGTSSVKLELYGSRSKGELLKVKNFLADQATAAFGEPEAAKATK